MWVWIPRYEYKITGQTIDVNFLDIVTSTATSGYTIHPAFQDGRSKNYINGEWKTEIAGIWVAKFEMAREDSSDSGQTWSQTTLIGNVQTIKSGTNQIRAVSKPGLSSWRTIDIGKCYTNSYEYDRTKESHLMKNSEWGMIAYLTQSKYGRNGTKVTINSNGDTYYTGGGIKDEYATTNTNQSTTGNPSGIYDLSGNAWEYAAAYITNGNDNLSTYGSSFASSTANTNPTNVSTEYATAYPYDSTDSEANNRTNFKTNYTGIRYGDAILETGTMTSTTGSWNSEYSNFPYTVNPFFRHGGGYISVSYAGMFSFYNYNGNAYPDVSFRVVLIP